MTSVEKEKRIADFLFEIGTMRKILRMHRQTLLTDDMSDNIASHSYRVALIGWFVAKEESADPYEVVMMCLLHDLDEVRSGDHNWVHKKYVKVFEDEIGKEQLGTLPYPDLKELWDKYNERKSREAIVAKDADILDQVLLLREYEWQGNKEALVWLGGKQGVGGAMQHVAMLKTETAKRLAEIIREKSPSEWWENIWTSQRRD